MRIGPSHRDFPRCIDKQGRSRSQSTSRLWWMSDFCILQLHEFWFSQKRRRRVGLSFQTLFWSSFRFAPCHVIWKCVCFFSLKLRPCLMNGIRNGHAKKPLWRIFMTNWSDDGLWPVSNGGGLEKFGINKTAAATGMINEWNINRVKTAVLGPYLWQWCAIRQWGWFVTSSAAGWMNDLMPSKALPYKTLPQTDGRTKRARPIWTSERASLRFGSMMSPPNN